MEHFQLFLLHVLVQLLVIIAVARIGAWILAKFGQPQVVGEIAAGLLLGPSCFGRLSPEAAAYVFRGDTDLVFKVMSEIGLVFLMFLIGLEFDFSHLRRVGRAAGGVALAGIVVPFTFGILLAGVMHPHVAPDVDATGFGLFVATALSITAVPVLGRIMIELNIHRTMIGALTIAAAAIDDALGWIVLATVGALVHGGFDFAATARMLALTAGFVLLCYYVVRPLVAVWLTRTMARHRGELTLGGMSVVMTLVLTAAVATSAIGIFAIFGPFVLGAVLSDQQQFREATIRRMREFTFAFFLPIFFTRTGLNTNVGLLDTYPLWLFCGLVMLAAIGGKALGCGLAARLGGLSPRQSATVATMMNARGLMGLIAVNVGRDMGVVPDSVFCMLVIMCLVTTFVTTPVLRRLLNEDVIGGRGVESSVDELSTVD
jgi:Kef-type K+ transport system membrane component KefB